MALGAGEVFQNLDFWSAIWCLPPALKRRSVEVGADVVIIGYNNNKQTKKLEIGKKYILQKQTTMHYTRASNIKLRQMCVTKRQRAPYGPAGKKTPMGRSRDDNGPWKTRESKNLFRI